MRKLARWAAIWATIAALAITAATAQTTDLLGAHNCYGRGCLACHVPHSGEGGNGTGMGGSNQPGLGAESDSVVRQDAIVRGYFQPRDPSRFRAASTVFAGATDPNFLIIACLSCHDGNLAKPGLMKGISVETLPVTGGHAPTLLANDGTVPGNYNNDHPIGPSARFACGGANNWDCAISSVGTVAMTGRYSSQFARNLWLYGFAIDHFEQCPDRGSARLATISTARMSGRGRLAAFRRIGRPPSSCAGRIRPTHPPVAMQLRNSAEIATPRNRTRCTG